MYSDLDHEELFATLPDEAFDFLKELYDFGEQYDLIHDPLGCCVSSQSIPDIVEVRHRFYESLIEISRKVNLIQGGTLYDRLVGLYEDSCFSALPQICSFEALPNQNGHHIDLS